MVLRQEFWWGFLSGEGQSWGLCPCCDLMHLRTGRGVALRPAPRSISLDVLLGDVWLNSAVWAWGSGPPAHP